MVVSLKVERVEKVEGEYIENTMEINGPESAWCRGWGCGSRGNRGRGEWQLL